MPINPAIIAAGIGVAGTLIGNRANNQAAQNANMLSYQQQMSMNAQQNKFNVDQWTRNNDYNSPEAQRQRLRQAGLNPNLVYGSGNGGNQPASPVSAANASAPNVRANRYDVPTNPILNYLNAQSQEAQTSNLRAQNTRLLEETELLRAQKMNVDAKTASTLLDTDIKSPMKQYSAQVAESLYAKLVSEVDVNNARAKFTGTQQTNVAWDNTFKEKTIYDRIRGIKSGADLRESQLEIQRENYRLMKLGITPNSPTWLRIMTSRFGSDAIKAAFNGN